MKCFLLFQGGVSKQKQLHWFVKMFIKKEYQDLDYVHRVEEDTCIKDFIGVSTELSGDNWVWLDKDSVPSYTKYLTQVYYSNLGEI